jgi:hypothetical protein
VGQKRRLRPRPFAPPRRDTSLPSRVASRERRRQSGWHATSALLDEAVVHGPVLGDQVAQALERGAKWRAIHFVARVFCCRARRTGRDRWPREFRSGSHSGSSRRSSRRRTRPWPNVWKWTRSCERGPRRTRRCARRLCRRSRLSPTLPSGTGLTTRWRQGVLNARPLGASITIWFATQARGVYLASPVLYHLPMLKETLNHIVHLRPQLLWACG